MAEDPLYDLDPETGMPKRVTAKERKQRVQQQLEEDSSGKKTKKGAKATVAKTRAKRTSTNGVQMVETESSTDTNKLQAWFAELPGGGSIMLLNPVEVQHYESIKSRYMKEYPFDKPNDLSKLAQLLTFELTVYRLTQQVMGQIPIFDKDGDLVHFKKVEPEDQANAIKNLPSVQSEIRSLELALRIDKKSREGEGKHEVRQYIETLKQAATDYGVHLSERYLKYDEFVNELRWKLRVLDNPDEQDRAYHNISADTILQYCRETVQEELVELDKKFAAEKQALWVGKL